MAHMAVVFAELERDFIRSRTREALAVRRDQGVVLGRPRSTPAEVVARVVREHTEGKTAYAIARDLNKDAVPTARGAPAWSQGRVRALPMRDLTVAPLDEKDVSCCSGPMGRRSKRESPHEPAARSDGPMEILMVTQAPFERVERDSVRLAAVLLLAGVLVSAIAGFLHPEGADANDHRTIFAIYAASQSWTAVHLGQFIGMVIITFGLVALFFALDVRSGVGLWLNRFALLSAGAAMALYGVLQAVDGVGLKQAVNAWASAESGDKAVRFAAAETVRWLEWAVRSYQSREKLSELRVRSRVDPLRRSHCRYGPGFAPDRLSHGALRPLLPRAGMDHRQQRFLLREPDPHSPRNRPDPRVDSLASRSGPPNEDRSAPRDHIRRNDLVHRVDLL
jgi:hypothetical protein